MDCAGHHQHFDVLNLAQKNQKEMYPMKKRKLVQSLLCILLQSASLTAFSQDSYPFFTESPQDRMPLDLFSPPLEDSILTKPVGVDLALGFNNNEPSIAVDPNNPLRVAVATYLSIRVSVNGGTTFLPAVAAGVPPTHSNARGGDSSLGYDSRGRLFWTYLLRHTNVNAAIDIFVAQCDPATGALLAGYPVNVTGSAGVNRPAPANCHDKSWLAVDSFNGSPFRDRLYLVWTDFTTNPGQIRATSSADQGQNWTASVSLSANAEGFVWPSHNTVAPNGDVYVAYHSQSGFDGSGAADGVSGQIFVLRSTDGGATYPQKRTAYAAGQADLTFNRQTQNGALAGTRFWLQGSVQPFILADPNTAGRIYVIANDDPDNTRNSGDDAAVFISRSTDNGLTWTTPAAIDNGPGATLQFMPTAAIDRQSGCITVHYYDTRRGLTNSSGNFLLDVFATRSRDGGVTFGPDFRINDVAFDPDPGAGCRWDCTGATPTTRIGEYNGVAVAGGLAFAVWTGNTVDGLGNPVGQQTILERYSCDPCLLTCPGAMIVNNDPDQCGATVSFPLPTTSGGCGVVSCQPSSASFFGVGTSIVTCTAASGDTCSFTVTVKDAQPPAITCPPDETVEFMTMAGAVVNYPPPVVSDNCPGATYACLPPAGSTFPIGTNTVTCTASDTSGNSTPCQFTVIVLGALGVKQNVLTELIALRMTVTGAEERRELDHAIDELRESVEPSLWIDQTHVNRKHGDEVFEDEQETVEELCELIKHKSSSVPDAVLQGFIDRIVKSDRLLASIAIQDAIAAGVAAKRIKEAQKELAEGDEELAEGECDEGIEDYKDAWKHAVRSKVSAPVHLANNSVRLEIMGESGKQFTIQASTNLLDWVNIGTSTANAEGVLTIEEPNAGRLPVRYYRAVAK